MLIKPKSQAPEANDEGSHRQVRKDAYRPEKRVPVTCDYFHVRAIASCILDLVVYGPQRRGT